MSKKIGFFSFSVFTLILSFAFSAAAAKYSDPHPDEILYRMQKAPSLEPLSKQLNVLVWNVHKGLDGKAWVGDFLKLSTAQDLVLLQEGTNDQINKSAYFADQSFGWWMGIAYIENATEVVSGVVTGAKANPIKHNYFLSESKEPVSQTGHTILASTFRREMGSADFLAVNVHGINFVLNKKWHRQMDAMEKLIASHQGPGIVAGDFNTWNAARENSLDRRLAKYGYKKVVLANDRRKMRLDHVFVKGCAVSGAVILNQVKTSDHKPIQLKLNCL